MTSLEGKGHCGVPVSGSRALNFDHGVQGEPHDLERSPRRCGIIVEVLSVDSVEIVVIVHVEHEDGALNDVVHGGATRGQDSLDVCHGLGGLGSDATIDELSSGGNNSDLSSSVDHAISETVEHFDALGVGSDSAGSFASRNDLTVGSLD